MRHDRKRDDEIGETDFQAAIAFNSLSGVEGGSIEASIGAAPWFTVLAGILTDNMLLTAIIMAGFVAWIWFWVPAELAYTTRTMIAWSFDRTAPEWLGYVSNRVHTPVVAIGLSTAIAIFFMWLIAYAGIAFLTLVEVLLVIWGTAMISAVLFLFRARFRNSIYRTAEGMTVFAVMTAGLFPLIHLGRVWNFYWLIPYPNQRQLWTNFRSPLEWDVFAVSTYLTISSVFFIVGLIPDVAVAREHATGWRKKLYTLLSFNWRGTDRQWKHYINAYT